MVNEADLRQNAFPGSGTRDSDYEYVLRNCFLERLHNVVLSIVDVQDYLPQLYQQRVNVKRGSNHWCPV